MQKWWMIFDLLVLACLGYPCEAETDGPSRNVTPCAFQLRFRKKDSHPCGCVWKWGIPPTIAIFHGENDDWPMGLGVPHFNPMCWWGGSAGGTKDDGSPLASAEAQGQEMCSGVSGQRNSKSKPNWHWQPNMAFWEIPCKWLYYCIFFRKAIHVTLDLLSTSETWRCDGIKLSMHNDLWLRRKPVFTI